jgi:quinol monooxygenase YgiN
MIVIERMIQEIYPGKQAELEDIDRRYDAIESTIGFPPKKRFWSISTPYDSNTIVLEREWESMAAMEAAYEKSFANTDIQALHKEGEDIIKSSRIELYTPMT